MATKYRRNASPTNTNWSSDDNWSTTSSAGTANTTKPIAGDAAILDAGSLATVIDTASACTSIDCTGYTNTLTFTANLTVAGAVTLASGMTLAGTADLICTTTATLTTALQLTTAHDELTAFYRFRLDVLEAAKASGVLVSLAESLTTFGERHGTA